jgi:16S rRNA (cytosine1402-N4)-methyltransferase
MGPAEPQHEPVLVEPLLELLAPEFGDRVLDLTVGLGGHSAELLRVIGPTGHLTAIDVDPGNLEVARLRLAAIGPNFELISGNFRDIQDGALSGHPLGRFNRVIADFGISSNQLDDAQRGLTFQVDGPLDMRLDPEIRTTAADLVNRTRERELSDLIYFNSQERFSRRIARQICEARKQRRITRTADLVRVICQALRVDPGSHREKIHPATRTFLALRIAVNGELDAIGSLLEVAPTLLEPCGRFAVISFHSLEDRLAKVDFRARKSAGTYRLITKKPIIADTDERKRNPRSRSAKMRVVERTDEPIES